MAIFGVSLSWSLFSLYRGVFPLQAPRSNPTTLVSGRQACRQYPAAAGTDAVLVDSLWLQREVARFGLMGHPSTSQEGEETNHGSQLQFDLYHVIPESRGRHASQRLQPADVYTMAWNVTSDAAFQVAAHVSPRPSTVSIRSFACSLAPPSGTGRSHDPSASLPPTERVQDVPADTAHTNDGALHGDGARGAGTFQALHPCSLEPSTLASATLADYVATVATRSVTHLARAAGRETHQRPTNGGSSAAPTSTRHTAATQESMPTASIHGTDVATMQVVLARFNLPCGAAKQAPGSRRSAASSWQHVAVQVAAPSTRMPLARVGPSDVDAASDSSHDTLPSVASTSASASTAPAPPSGDASSSDSGFSGLDPGLDPDFTPASGVGPNAASAPPSTSASTFITSEPAPSTKPPAPRDDVTPLVPSDASSDVLFADTLTCPSHTLVQIEATLVVVAVAGVVHQVCSDTRVLAATAEGEGLSESPGTVADLQPGASAGGWVTMVVNLLFCLTATFGLTRLLVSPKLDFVVSLSQLPYPLLVAGSTTSQSDNKKLHGHHRLLLTCTRTQPTGSLRRRLQHWWCAWQQAWWCAWQWACVRVRAWWGQSSSMAQSSGAVMARSPPFHAATIPSRKRGATTPPPMSRSLPLRHPPSTSSPPGMLAAPVTRVTTHVRWPVAVAAVAPDTLSAVHVPSLGRRVHVPNHVNHVATNAPHAPTSAQASAHTQAAIPPNSTTALTSATTVPRGGGGISNAAATRGLPARGTHDSVPPPPPATRCGHVLWT